MKYVNRTGKGRSRAAAAAALIAVLIFACIAAGCSALEVSGRSAKADYVVTETAAAAAYGGGYGYGGSAALSMAAMPEAKMAVNEDAVMDSYAMDAPAEAASTSGSGSGGISGGSDPSAPDSSLKSGERDASRVKLITTVSLSLETTELDKLMDGINAKIAELGGYVENSGIYSYNDVKNANITVRIPDEKREEFLNTAFGDAKVLSENVNTEDVTLTYSDIEARIETLRVEQTRLTELLAQADSIEAVIALESRLSEISYELESRESRLRDYDNKVFYSTIYIDVREVSVVTTTGSDTFLDKIIAGLQRNVLDLIDAVTDLIIWFITSLPTIIVLVIVVFALYKAARAFIRSRSTRSAGKKAKAGTAAANAGNAADMAGRDSMANAAGAANADGAQVKPDIAAAEAAGTDQGDTNAEQ